MALVVELTKSNSQKFKIRKRNVDLNIYNHRYLFDQSISIIKDNSVPVIMISEKSK